MKEVSARPENKSGNIWYLQLVPLTLLKINNKMVKTTAKVKTGWRSKSQPEKTYIVRYCIPPDYETELTLELTGKYTYVRFVAMRCLGSNAVIFGIDEKI